MAKCDLCHEREATLKVRRVSKDGEPEELQVCAECARARGFAEAEGIKATVAEVFEEMKKKVATEDEKLACSGCGMTFAEFKRLGRVGCARCYEDFRQELGPIIRRIQGAVQHVGRTTRSGHRDVHRKMNVDRLREELKNAIRDEEYEEAAALRDRLTRAEKDAEG